MKKILAGLFWVLLAAPLFGQSVGITPIRELIGVYSNLRYIEEAGDVVGDKLVLYRDNSRYFGYFTVAEGEARTAPIEHVVFDPVSGNLSFECLIVLTEVRSATEQNQTGWFYQAKGIIQKEGFKLQLLERIFDRGSKNLNVGWEPSFDKATEELLPIDTESLSDYSPISYLDWRLETQPNKFSDEPIFNSCPAPNATPKDTGSPLEPAKKVPSLTTYAYWTNSINGPVIILITIAFLLGSIMSIALVRLSHNS